MRILHQTDLYHPALDPDDHWDLACEYALDYSGMMKLSGIVMDNVPQITLPHGDPSIYAVNQLNYITGRFIPVAIGTSYRFNRVTAEFYQQHENKFSGVNLIKSALQNAESKLAIQIVGSSKDIAITIRLYPELFKEKCSGIYLNGGSCSGLNEYNASIDPKSFCEIFNAECPVFWIPPGDEPGHTNSLNEHCSHYSFQQGDILPYLSEKLQRYFVYGLGRVEEQKWLSYLDKRTNKELFNQLCKYKRDMWSTAGILTAAGYSVLENGCVIPLKNDVESKVFGFTPIEVQCDEYGEISWKKTNKNTNRYIFQILNMDQYSKAMTLAMKTLLKKIQ